MNTLKDLVEQRLQQSEMVQTLEAADVADIQSATGDLNIPEYSKAGQEALKAAHDAFAASDVGIMLSAEAFEMSPAKVMQTLPKIREIPEIEALAKLARQPTLMFATEDSPIKEWVKEFVEEHAPQSVLIQFCATADIVAVSGTVYIGFALNLTDLNQASLYVGGGVGVGPGALVAAGQGVGLTGNAYSGMTGACVGVDGGGAYVAGGLIDVSVGINAPYFPVVTHINLAGWTGVAYFLEGAGGGAEGYVGFTLKLVDESLPNMVQPDADNYLVIYSIDCIKRNDTSGKDEITFDVAIDGNYYTKYQYPMWDHYSIAEGGVWDVGYGVKFNNSFVLTLYESGEEITNWTVTTANLTTPSGYSYLEYSVSGVFVNDVDYKITLYTPPAP